MSGRDGIMSAIDCNINCDIYKDKTSNDRIIITIDRKFLEYKTVLLKYKNFYLELKFCKNNNFIENLQFKKIFFMY